MTLGPTSTPVPEPSATPTPKGPHLLKGATIGGTCDGFTSRYGPPGASGNNDRYSFTTADGLNAIVQLGSMTTGKDSQSHVNLFTEAPAAGTGPWTTAQSKAVAHLFFPPDAVYVRTFTDPDLGPFRVYQSADLAATFPISEFYDSNSNTPLPPGTFSIVCGDQTAGCSFGIGT